MERGGEIGVAGEAYLISHLAYVYTVVSQQMGCLLQTEGLDEDVG